MRRMLLIAVLISNFIAISVSDAAPGVEWVSINDPGFNGRMSKYEITNAQYCLFLNDVYATGDVFIEYQGNEVLVSLVSKPYMSYYRLNGPGSTGFGATNGGASRINWTGSSFTVDSGFENHPVTYVSWYGATAFCDYYGYRLPTEREWEAVADYDGTFEYIYDPNYSDYMANFRLVPHPHGTREVGSFGAYGYGLCDMAGNVFEWTDTVYSGLLRVARGGCWTNQAIVFTAYYRTGLGFHQGGGIYPLGFRVCYDHPALIRLTAKNKWDGKTIDLSWSSGAGSVNIHRTSIAESDKLVATVSGSSYTDDSIPEPGEDYTYVLKDASGTAISEEATVKAEVIVVLVRGNAPFGSGVNLTYWSNNGIDPTYSGDVTWWFDRRGVTCWDASSDLNGRNTVAWNAASLYRFVLNKLSLYGDIKPDKINLVCHSMGGLIGRKYASEYQDAVLVDKIFTLQTPHTGSPLADIRGLWPNNPAIENLKADWLDGFNQTCRDLGDARLYIFWSVETWKESHDPELLVLEQIIMPDLRWSTIPHVSSAVNDGLVPVLSAMGQIKTGWLNISIDHQVDIDVMKNSYLDHTSVHKYYTTLGQILYWMGLDLLPNKSNQPGLKAEFEKEAETTHLRWVNGFVGQLSSSESVAETVTIGDSSSAYFRAATADSNCIFTLENPNSLTIDPAYAAADPNITYDSEHGSFMYEVTNPTHGVWTLHLAYTWPEPNTVDYGLSVFESGNITLSSYPTPSWGNTDANILCLAGLTEDESALTGASIVADIELPDGSTSSLNLYDDGLHGDANAADGNYANTFAATNQVGMYNCYVNATGISSSGVDFERSSSLSFTISSAGIDFLGNITDVGIELDENGLYDLLSFSVPVHVNEPNEFLLTADLYDSNDNLIKLLTTNPVDLAPGPNTLNLKVMAEDIATHGVDGPYRLTDITISDANTGLTIAVADDYVTGPYAASSFEQLDSDGDGLSDSFEALIGANPNLRDSDYDGVMDYNEVSYDADGSSYNPSTDLNPIEADTDGDGMDDGWEILFGFNPLLDDGAKNGDHDGDGLVNLEEFQNSTLPTFADTDDDGLDDGNEVNVYGSNPRKMDTDLDGSLDGSDNCKIIWNPGQSDMDGDGIGDDCDCLPDLTNSNGVTFDDVAVFAQHWGETDCLGLPDPDYCGAADFNKSGTVDAWDLEILAEQWLSGIIP